MLDTVEGMTDEGERWISLVTREGVEVLNAVEVAEGVYEGSYGPFGQTVRGTREDLLSAALLRSWRLVA